METITQLISNMGFPIAMCILMYMQNKTILTEIKDSLNNNTLALNEVVNLVKELRAVENK